METLREPLKQKKTLSLALMAFLQLKTMGM